MTRATGHRPGDRSRTWSGGKSSRSTQFGTGPSRVLRAATQAALKQRLRFQAQLLDSVRKSLIATDLDGLVTDRGKGTQTLSGYHGPGTAAGLDHHHLRAVRYDWRGEYTH